MNSNILEGTTSNFETAVLKSEMPVLVDFWAEWCGPCRMVGPIMEELATEFKGKVKILKLNVDEQGEIATKYRIMSIPTIYLFKNGEVVDKTIGARSKSEFSDMIKKYI